MELDPTINAALVSVLAWAFVGAVGLLGSVLTWFGIRTVNQLDRIEAAQRTDVAAIYTKFDTLEKLVTNEMHKMDLRVARIEEWRKAREDTHHERAP